MKAATKAATAIFTFNNTSPIRVEVDADGMPWFCAKDVCGVLGYANDADALKKHCRAAGVAKRYLRSGGQSRGLTFIDEGNLYRLVIKSRMPAAERFEAWVCDDVLPTLRKTGTYALPGSPHATAGAEALTAADMANLRRAIWRVVGGHVHSEVLVSAIYTRLRKAAGTKAGQPFLVDHLPTIGQTLREICQTADALTISLHTAADILADAIKRGTSPGIADMMRMLPKAAASMQQSARWSETEIARLEHREAPVMDHPECMELAAAA